MYELSGHSHSKVGWILGLCIFLAFFCGVQIGSVFGSKGPRMLVLGGGNDKCCHEYESVGITFLIRFLYID